MAKLQQLQFKFMIVGKEKKKLKGRDLINVGIYGAIYFVILFAVAMLGMIPIFLPLLSVLVPLLGGIPFMLFLTKVKKPGICHFWKQQKSLVEMQERA